MKKSNICFIVLIYLAVYPGTANSEQTIYASRVEHAPVIDGMENDDVWRKAGSILTHDNVAGIDISLKAVYTDKEICFLAVFPDPDETREHKPLVWDKNEGMYKTGPERGDCFVFKWSMEPEPVDLSVHGDKPYKADIWFWKAERTDPSGYADDKQQILCTSRIPKSVSIISKNHHVFYLARPGDMGEPAYKADIPIEYKGDKISRFQSSEPLGSRADIRAKGKWKHGKWIVEFKRLLFTGHMDDIQFQPGRIYLFGVSRYEIGGKKYIPGNHLYGSGDVSETLFLEFGK